MRKQGFIPTNAVMLQKCSKVEYRPGLTDEYEVVISLIDRNREDVYTPKEASERVKSYAAI
ncbi:unnamed protein product [Bathycoccus prasinos]